jgi:hypothetical protein
MMASQFLLYLGHEMITSQVERHEFLLSVWRGDDLLDSTYNSFGNMPSGKLSTSQCPSLNSLSLMYRP